MPVVGGGDGEGVVGAGRRRGGGGQRGRRAQAAGHGDLRAHRHREAVVTEDLGDDPRRQVRRVVEETCTLALGVHLERLGRLHLDADVAVERDGQGVEAGPEVGRGGGGPGAHGGSG